MNEAKILEFDCIMLGNIVGKGENAVYQYLLLFPHCFR